MPHRILIVDDHRDIVRLLHSALDSLEHKFEIIEAPSGEEAFLKAKNWSEPDDYMNKKISGTVIFKETKRGLQIKINMSGISQGLHGFHIHEYGDLSEGCGSLCSHFNPTNSVHGGRDSPDRHLGDLGNIIADNSDNVDMIIYDKNF